MRDDARVEIAGLILDRHDFELRLQTLENIAAEPFDAWRGVVILDTKIYPELQAEGWARDFVRLVQSARKKADFNVTDRVDIVASISPELVHALTEHRDYIATETLAASLRVSPNLIVERDFVDEEIDQYRVRLHIERVASR